MSAPDSDELFVREAKAKWPKLLDASEGKDGATAALMISLWATLHMDRLIQIAERRAGDRV